MRRLRDVIAVAAVFLVVCAAFVGGLALWHRAAMWAGGISIWLGMAVIGVPIALLFGLIMTSDQSDDPL